MNFKWKWCLSLTESLHNLFQKLPDYWELNYKMLLTINTSLRVVNKMEKHFTMENLFSKLDKLPENIGIASWMTKWWEGSGIENTHCSSRGLGSVPSTSVVACNHLKLIPESILLLFGPHGHCAYRQNTYTYKINKPNNIFSNWKHLLKSEEWKVPKPNRTLF